MMLKKKRKSKSINNSDYDSINPKKKIKNDVEISGFSQNILTQIKNETVIAKLNAKNDIMLTVENKIRKFHTPETNIELAEEEFSSFLKIEKDDKITNKKKFEKLSKILELCEINPKYNFYYLLYFSKCLNNNNEAEFYIDQEILNFTLTKEDYSQLYNKFQRNIFCELFNLLKLCHDKNNTIKIDADNNYNNFNIPLIKAPEKFRLNLYKHRINESNPDIRNKISNYRDLILEMEKKFKYINLEEKEINILIYFFLYYV